MCFCLPQGLRHTGGEFSNLGKASHSGWRLLHEASPDLSDNHETFLAPHTLCPFQHACACILSQCVQKTRLFQTGDPAHGRGHTALPILGWPLLQVASSAPQPCLPWVATGWRERQPQLDCEERGGQESRRRSLPVALRASPHPCGLRSSAAAGPLRSLRLQTLPCSHCISPQGNVLPRPPSHSPSPLIIPTHTVLQPLGPPCCTWKG